MAIAIEPIRKVHINCIKMGQSLFWLSSMHIGMNYCIAILT